MTDIDTDNTVRSVLEKHRAVILDFTSESFDFFRYHGKAKISDKSLKNKGIYWTCVKLAKQYDDEELTKLFVAYAITNKNWIGAANDEAAKKAYLSLISTNQKLGYLFNNEVSAMFDACSTPFKVKSSGELPEVLTRIMSGEMSLLVASVLDKYVGFSKLLDNSLDKNHVIWSDYRIKIMKLHRFLDIDSDKIKASLNSVLTNLQKGAVQK